jgi:hypothetical protein
MRTPQYFLGHMYKRSPEMEDFLDLKYTAQQQPIMMPNELVSLFIM